MATLHQHDPRLGRFVVGIRPLLVAEGDERRPGVEVPEAFTFTKRRIRSLLSTRRLVFVPNAGDRKLVDLLLAKLSKKQIDEVAGAYGVTPAETRDETARILLLAAAFDSEPEPEPEPDVPTKAEAALTDERDGVRGKLEALSEAQLAAYAPNYGVVTDGKVRDTVIDELVRILAPDPRARVGTGAAGANGAPMMDEELPDDTRFGVPKQREVIRGE
jgi:hypothetical protein